MVAPLNVDLQLATDSPGVPNAESFSAWAAAVFDEPDAAGELVIRVVGAAESRTFNRRYRGADRPTNVLSFPFEAPPEVPLNLLGDLVICAPVVIDEAARQGKCPEAHWAHMVVHGVLHLLGYDHQTEPDAAVMETRECEILTELGFPDPYTTE